MLDKNYKLPDISLFGPLPWLRNVSVWSAPPKEQRADIRDSYLLGGGGHLSARVGTRDRVSTMERIMAPYLSSYNFGENANFRMDVIRPSRDFYPPFEFVPTVQHVWRVRGTAIVITAERDSQYELVTVNAVHPVKNVYLRVASLRNISDKPITDIGISVDAQPDIPYPVGGHRSFCYPLHGEMLIEELEEMLPMERDFSQHYSNNRQRMRYMARGVVGARNRGYQDLFIHRDVLQPGETVEAWHYMAPGMYDSRDHAIEAANRIHGEIAGGNGAALFTEIQKWWITNNKEETLFASSSQEMDDLIDANLVMQASVERATGGYVVIDDYTGSWLRDHNGSHILNLDFGHQESVLQSMDRYYALDCSSQSLFSFYASDVEPYNPLPKEPDWENVQGFVTGDVPNFRTMWYWWYYKHTGDLELVRERFEYMKGSFLRQKLHDNGFLANFCFDETYGIGPIGPMRTGKSADNSFNALAASQRLAYFAKQLGRHDADFFAGYTAQIKQAIEDAFWLEKEGYYAMRITPEGLLDKTPLSIGMLCPLWIGAAANDDEHAGRSAEYVYKHLYQKNGFLRLIPSHDQTVTMAIGYLLFALKRMRHPEIDRVIIDTMKWADPSGTFGEYLDDGPNGPVQCYEHMAHRNRMWESGINTDALFFAFTGYDPEINNWRIKLEPHLPKGWTHHKITNHRVQDGRLSMETHREKGHMRYELTGSFLIPLNIEFTCTSTSPKATVTLNDNAVSVSWTKNRLGVYHAMLEFQLDKHRPVTLILKDA